MSAGPASRVLVLMPVYNGEPYLREQIDSILEQDGVDARILCRDDQSTDNSVAILDEYAAAMPDRLRRMPGERNLGASASFSRLMQYTIEEDLLDEEGVCIYIAFADQDDRWHPERLNQCLEAMHRLERQAGHATPLLVHSDLRVVTDGGEEIAPSMAAYQGLEPTRTSLGAQLMSNTVTGCTALINPALLRKALPVPAEAIMHDWWLSLVASAFGRRRYIDHPLVDYRQHDTNAIGARAWQKPAPGRDLLKRLLDRRHTETFHQTAAQASAFARQYDHALSNTQKIPLHMVHLLAVNNPIVQKVIFRGLRRM